MPRHIWLEGFNSTSRIQPAIKAFEEVSVTAWHHLPLSSSTYPHSPPLQFRLTYTSHLMLAHLRRSHALLPAFAPLAQTLPPDVFASFEHPLLRSLHEALVIGGLFMKAESILEQGLASGLLAPWASGGGKGTRVAHWEYLGPPRNKPAMQVMGEETQDSPTAPEEDWPSRRGGHQLVRVGRKLLLFGGWNGDRDLGDLWEYELPRSITANSDTDQPGRWRCLERGDEGTAAATGSGGRVRVDGPPTRPAARSCHQMAVDESEGWVYLLGATISPEDKLRNEDSQQDSDNEPTRSGRSRSNNNNTNEGSSAEGGDGVEVAMEVEDASTGARHRSTGRDRDFNPNPWYLSPWSSDFWRYKAVGPGKGTWELLSGDTSAENGPAKL